MATKRKFIKQFYGKNWNRLKDSITDDGFVIVPYSQNHIESIQLAGFDRQDVDVKTIPGCHLWRPKNFSFEVNSVEEFKEYEVIPDTGEIVNPE